MLFSLAVSSLFGGNLSLSEVKSVVEEIFTLHVDEHAFNEKIAYRSFKNYLTRFDSNYKYLLNSEVESFFYREEPLWKEVVSKYEQGDFAPYRNLNSLIAKSILRAKKIRREIQALLLSRNEYKKSEKHPLFFPKTEEELRNCIEDEMQGWLFDYATEHKLAELSTEQKKKIFEFYEKKKEEHEEAYLSSHNIALHVVKAISSALDAHTTCYSDEEALELRKVLRKEFCGLGIHLKESVDGPFVSYIVPHSPAEAAGLIKVGDRIKEIDGQATDKITYREVLSKLIGEPHSTVSLALEKEGGKKEIVRLKREKMILEEERIKIEYEPFGDGIIGILTFSSFYDNGEGLSVEYDLRQALTELKGIAPLNGLILDMRQNTGGFLNQAVQVAGLFLQKGTVVVAKYANDEIRFTRNLDPKLFYQGPLVLLTSKASASAAEIVVQTLQDEGVAIVVGDKRSYGKGSMQYQTVTDSHAKYFYKVTVGRYFTLSGKSPQIDGVKADVVVPTHYAALHLGEKYLPYPLQPEKIDLKKDIQKELKQIFIQYQKYSPTAWQKMLPTLAQNSELRKENNLNLQLFYRNLEDPSIPFKAKTAGCGTEDLQKREAINIIKDMILISRQEIKI